MKGEVNPVVGGIIIAMVVLVLVVLGFHWLHAPHYKMSPGGGPRGLSSNGSPSPSSGGGTFMPSGGKAVSSHSMPPGGMMNPRTQNASGSMNGAQ